jgi:hypothetical protein
MSLGIYVRKIAFCIQYSWYIRSSESVPLIPGTVSAVYRLCSTPHSLREQIKPCDAGQTFRADRFDEHVKAPAPRLLWQIDGSGWFGHCATGGARGSPYSDELSENSFSKTKGGATSLGIQELIGMPTENR